jgi:nucleotide-binding universal stress UspA family protein
MRILLGVDLNAPGHEWLVERAGRFAGRASGRLDLWFVARAPEPDARDEQRLAHLLDRVPEAHRGAIHRAVGDPVQTLLTAATDYDAIVIGPRNPGAIERMIRGSVAMRVVHAAPGSVLVPRGEGESRGAPRVVVAVDLDSDPEGLVDGAARWAKAMRARLDVAWVDPAAPPEPEEVAERTALRQRLEAARAPQRARLEALLARIDRAHRGEVRLEEGDPLRVLIDLSIEVDLLVVGTLGRGGWFGAWRASIAESLVRDARCDVLTIRTHPRSSEPGSA